MIKLEKCPFCGSDAKLYVDDGVCVKCTDRFKKDCRCNTGWYSDDNYFINDWLKMEKTAVEKAIDAWNRRTNNDDK